MKGAIQLILIGLIVYFIAIIFIFSVMFGRAETTVRQLGDIESSSASTEMETYIESFLSSNRLSLVQSLYQNGIKSATEYFQEYSLNRLNDNKINEIRDSIVTSTVDYSKEFLSKYKTYAEKEKTGIEVTNKNELNSERSNFANDFIQVVFRPIMFKVSPDPTTFKRTFSPEARIETYFQEMLKKAQDMTKPENDDVRRWVVAAINLFLNGQDSSCKKKIDGGELGTVNVPPKSKSTSEEFCETSSEPTAEEIFAESNKMNFVQVESCIKSEIKNQLKSLANVLSSPEKYNFNFEITDETNDLKARVEASTCSNFGDFGGCDCYIDDKGTKNTTLDDVEVCPSKMIKKTCEYSYYGAVRANAKASEVKPRYAVWDGGSTVLDNLKILFKVVSGNKELIASGGGVENIPEPEKTYLPADRDEWTENGVFKKYFGLAVPPSRDFRIADGTTNIADAAISDGERYSVNTVSSKAIKTSKIFAQKRIFLDVGTANGNLLDARKYDSLNFAAKVGRELTAGEQVYVRLWNDYDAAWSDKRDKACQLSIPNKLKTGPRLELQSVQLFSACPSGFDMSKVVLVEWTTSGISPDSPLDMWIDNFYFEKG